MRNSNHLNLAADDIRRRERSRRRQDSAWGVISLLVHVALFAVFVFCTPVRQIIIPKPKKQSNPAKDLSADRIEQIADALTDARLNELLRQIDMMQTILHDMDLMKNELQKDYDEFSQKSATTSKERIERMLDDAQNAQTMAAEAQSMSVSVVESIAGAEKVAISEPQAQERLRSAAEELTMRTGAKVTAAQALLQNALDRAQVEAAFAGYKKTSEAADALRDAQVEVSRDETRLRGEITSAAGKIQRLPDVLRELETREEALAKDLEQIASQQNALEDLSMRKEQLQNQERELAEKNTALETARKDAVAAAGKLAAAEKAERHAAADSKKAKKYDVERQHYQKADQIHKAVTAKYAEADELNKEREPVVAQLRKVQTDVRTLDSDVRRTEQALKNATTSRDRNQKRLDELRITKADIDKTLASDVVATQVDRIVTAKERQSAVAARVPVIRALLEAESAEPDKVAVQMFVDNEMVRASADTLEGAYELARSLESAITESYKDIKATQTAIEARMAFAAAQQITDVAKSVRAEFPDELKAENARTKEQLDAQKEAQKRVMLEVSSMSETSLAMFDDAVAIVRPFPDLPHMRHQKQDKTKMVEWFTEDMLAERASDVERTARVDKMFELAEFTAQVEAAAAEDASEQSKDLTEVMAKAASEDPSVEEFGSGESGGAPLPKLDSRQSARRISVPAQEIAGDKKDLLPGNVFRTRADSGDGVPATWMYVNSWYVIGPFPNPDRVNIHRKFPPESVIDLDATYIGKDGRTVRWIFEQARSSTRWAHNRAVLIPGSAEEYGIWYAYTEIFADDDCDAWVALGSDDRSDVWVNSVKVWGSSDQLKAWNIKEGYRKLRFKKGRNKILCRVENGWHVTGWSFCVSLTGDTAGL